MNRQRNLFRRATGSAAVVTVLAITALGIFWPGSLPSRAQATCD